MNSNQTLPVRNILVIYTGGTIGMIQDPETGSLVPFNFDNVYEHIPMLRLYKCNLVFKNFLPLIDSSNVKPEFWVDLVTSIQKNYELYDGFVVLHGSDTMAYTASALSFMLENLNKPVVLTGSQLPLGVIRTDGRENIINAIEVAAAYEDDTPMIPEVVICFENKIYRGNRTHKKNAENFDAFVSSNYPVLAEAGVHIRYSRDLIIPPNFKKLKVHTHLDNNIAILKLFPGINSQVVSSILGTEGLRAVILETYGSGNAPTNEWFISQLKSAIDRGVIIINVTQCKGGGTVELGKYETSLLLGEIGVIGGFDITTEAAVTKLMFLLGTNKSKNEIETLMQKPLRGEITI